MPSYEVNAEYVGYKNSMGLIIFLRLIEEYIISP